MSTDEPSDAPSWIRVDGRRNGTSRTTPEIVVMQNGDLYINSETDRQLLEHAEHAYLHVDPDGGWLGLEPTSTDDDASLSVTRSYNHGGKVAGRLALTEFGIDADDIEESFAATAREFDEIIGIDISPLIERLSGETSSTEADEADEEGDADAGSGAEASAETEPPSESESEETATDADGDSAISQIDREGRQRIARHIDEALDTTAEIVGGAGDLVDALGVGCSAQSLAQNLRYLRDDDRDYPFTIRYLDDEDSDRKSRWRLDVDDGREIQRDEDEDDPVRLVETAIETGLTDVHEIAAETGLATTKVRGVARQLERYSELHDAAGGNGYGRGDV
jgi:hypothetical protein